MRERAWNPQPCYEPVSTAVGLTALISGATGASAATAGAIGGAIISTGATLAASFAFNSASLNLQNQDRQSQLRGGEGVSTQDQGTREPTIGPVPRQRLVLGAVTSSGALLWRRSDPPHIWRTYALAAHKCGAFEALFMTGEQVLLQLGATSGTLVPLDPPWTDGSTNFIEIAYRDGDENQAMDPILARDFPDLPATFRQRGTATVTIKANYGADNDEHGQIYGTEDRFNPLFRFEGATHFDPRVPGCALDDPETWVHSSNASLNLMRWLTHPWPDMRLLDPGDVDWDLMAEAADVDDQMVGVMGSDGNPALERNHTIDGIVLSDFDPLEKLKEMLTANDGHIVCRAGKYHVMPGQKQTPVMTLTQEMLASGFELHTETPDAELINTVKTEFAAPERDYRTQTGPVVKRPDWVSEDGRPLETTLSLPYTEGPNGAARPQRLAARKLKDSRGPSGSPRKSFTGTFTQEARRARAGTVVRLHFRDFPHCNGDYLVRRVERPDRLRRIQLELVQWDNARFRFHAPTDQKSFTIDTNVLDAQAA